MINEAIIKLAAKEDLSYEMAMGAMDEIMVESDSGTDERVSDGNEYEGGDD